MSTKTKKMNRLTLAAAAMLLSAIPVANLEASAYSRNKTVNVAMTYDGTAAPERIYSSLRRQARQFCAPSALNHQHLSWGERRCVTQLVGKAVDRINRPALADVHENRGRLG